MNRIILISTPLITEHRDPVIVERMLRRDPVYSVPHLGILTVAALFKKYGWAVKLFRVDEHYASHITSRKDAADFCDDFARVLANEDAKYFGFSSICSSYYITLMVAERLKEFRPDAVIVFGGPQASATGPETMSLSAAVDFILRGEVELSLKDFLECHLSAPERVPGLCFRRDSEVISNALPPLPNAGALEMPLYDLWDMSDLGSIPIEGGRGCPFKCKFCSTSPFFRRSYRVKDPQTLIVDAVNVAARFSVRNVSFIHDCLFVSKRTCEQFCDAWGANKNLRGIHWSCSLRADLIDERIAGILGRSNCSGVFVGIESGSERMQKIIDKNLDVEKAVATIQLLNANNVYSTASFIIGFPEETVDDFRETLCRFGQTLRVPLCRPQVSSLSILAGSGYSNSASEFDAGGSTISHQGPPIAPIYTKYINAHRALFSAHFRPVLKHLNHDVVRETEFFLNYSLTRFRWLVALLAVGFEGGLHPAIERWLRFKREEKGEAGDLFNYYSTIRFQRQFIEFVTTLGSLPQFNSAFSSVQQFLCSVYSVEDKYWQEVVALGDARISPTPLKSDDYVLRGCLLVEVEYSFSDAIRIIAAEGQGNLHPKDDSCIVIYTKSRNVIVEEPTTLVRRILSLASVPIKAGELVRKLRDDANSGLPSSVSHKASAACFYSLKECLARGLLVRAAEKEKDIEMHIDMRDLSSGARAETAGSTTASSPA